MVDTCRHGGRYGDLAAFNPSIAKLANGSLLVFFRVSSMSMCMGRSTGVWAFPKYAHARRHAHVGMHSGVGTKCGEVVLAPSSIA